MNEIYGDIYFFVNFSMDLVCLYITCLILRKNTGIGRLIMGAAFGAFYSLLTLFFSFDLTLRFTMTFLVAFVICFLSFFEKQNPRDFIFPSFVFIAISFFMGGSLTYLYSFLGGVFKGEGNEFSILLLPCAFFFGITSFLLSRISEKKRSVLKTRIMVSTGVEREFSALVDTGNLLREPIAGLPVVILSEKASRAYIKNGDLTPASALEYPELGNEIRVIPMNGAGISGILTGFIPKGGVTVSGKTKKCCVAFSKTQSFDGCEALLPYALFS